MTTETEQPLQTCPPSGRRWALLREAQAYARVSERTLRRLAAEGLLRLYKPRGGRVLIDLDELDRALAGSTLPA